MKTLATENRLMIMCHLVDQERSVGELCELVQMKPPAMSQQLSLLRVQGFVNTRRNGQTIYYSIADDNIRKLMEFLHDTYCTIPQTDLATS
ncbi:MAG: ArsR/SmtB family transcription factor [bacterium]